MKKWSIFYLYCFIAHVSQQSKIKQYLTVVEIKRERERVPLSYIIWSIKYLKAGNIFQNRNCDKEIIHKVMRSCFSWLFIRVTLYWVDTYIYHFRSEASIFFVENNHVPDVKHIKWNYGFSLISAGMVKNNLKVYKHIIFFCFWVVTL